MAAGQLVPEPWQKYKQLKGVPVFVYHGLTGVNEIDVPVRERKYWVRYISFVDQLRQISRSGYSVRLLNELGEEQGAASVVLTFDDGRVSDYELAYRALLEAKMKAHFFVNTATVGLPGHLNWRQVIEMQRAGMSFQSHSHEHIYLTRLRRASLEAQLADSKCMLEDRLGSRVNFLAVPYGDVNRRVLEVARQVGYEAVCNSRSWPARPNASCVNRVAVFHDTGSQDFKRLLTGSLVAYLPRTALEAIKYVPKRFLLNFKPISQSPYN